MAERLIDQKEWEAHERYLRFASHAKEAHSEAFIWSNEPLKSQLRQRGERWGYRAEEAKAEWQNLVKERESK